MSPTRRAIVAVWRTVGSCVLIVLLWSPVDAAARQELAPADRVLPAAGQTGPSPRRAFSVALLASIFLVQTVLVLGLVTLAVKRQRLQRSLDRRLRFERLLSDITLTFARVGADRIGPAIDAALVRAAAAMGVDHVWLWNPDDEATDAAWSSLRLECGEPAMIASVDELPPSVRARVAQAEGGFSAAATPLQVGGAVLGALFWGSFRNVGSWSGERLSQLRMISDAFAGVLQRMKADGAREESDRLNGAILSSLPARIAVLDSSGVIISVNDAWTQFERSQGISSERELSPGTNYLDACLTAAHRGHPTCAETLAGIEAACRGEQQAGEHEYRCEASGQECWFVMTAAVLRRPEGGVVVTHRDITERKEAEERLADLSRRLIVAQEEERRRIARELHDHLSQQLALLAIELQQLDMHPPDTLSATLHDLWRRTTEIASDVHGISHRLHPSKLEALGAVITMRGHCRDISRHGVRVHFTDRDVPADLPPDIALCLFRILEEAVSNAVRHSASTEAFVTLERVDQDVVLRVVDAGCGFDPVAKRQAAGLGLVSMRERVRAVGGTLTITSSPGHGTSIEARVRHAAAVEAVEAITNLATAPFTPPPPDVLAQPSAVRAVG